MFNFELRARPGLTVTTGLGFHCHVSGNSRAGPHRLTENQIKSQLQVRNYFLGPRMRRPGPAPGPGPARDPATPAAALGTVTITVERSGYRDCQL